MGWYLIELPEDAPTPHARETDAGMTYEWVEMPRRVIDVSDLLAVADECEAADVDGCTDWPQRIRKAVGHVSDD